MYMDQAFALLLNFALHYNGGRAPCNQYSVGPLAQLVERRADNAKAVSSSLTWTKLLLFCSTLRYITMVDVHLATSIQLVH